MSNYQRTAALEVINGANATRHEGMHLRFSVRQSAQASAHSATISYSMPPADLVGTLGIAGVVVRLLAGYADGGGAQEIERGTIVKNSVKDYRGTSDPRVEFQISGARGPLLAAPLSRHFPGPVLASEVIEAIRSDLGIPADVIRLGDDLTFRRGYTVSGSARIALEDLAASTGSRWSLPSGRLRVWPSGESARRTADLWTVDTGLVDLSGPADRGRVRASALLRPGLRPGDLVRIRDTQYSGDVSVEECAHDGDSEGSAWYTTITGRPVNA